jgi:uncharacterized protein YndB with AHSA1/START domain
MQTESQPSTTDKIQKKILLRAARSRVWRAISNSKEFGTWFGMKVDAPFVAGATLAVSITPTKVDPAVAKEQAPYDGMPFEIVIDKVEPERHFSFRWHPYGVEAGVEYTNEPMTLVTFDLEETTGGVMLTITESGFDRIPLARRAKAFAANEGGWEAQTKLIEKYLAQQAS